MKMTRGYLGVIQTLQQKVDFFDSGGDAVNAIYLFVTGEIMPICLDSVG